jgi:hypothetical protein
MIRAIRLLVPIAVLAIVITNARTQDAPSNAVNTRVHNLIGMVDYSVPPDFKIGSWVKYAARGGSSDGSTQAFVSVILVPAEERFWGDDGFWVESWLQPAGDSTTVPYATLMSYAVFQDSFPIPRMLYYTRKQISGVDESGKLIEEISRRNPNSFKVRKWLSEREGFATDTLGPDTVVTPLGTVQCQKYRLRRGTGKTEDTADSTVYSEMRETRTVYMSKTVPITHLVREEIEYSVKRRAWKVGQSQEGAPFQLLEESRLSTRLLAYGNSGLHSQLLPPSRCKSLRELYPPQAAATTKAPAKAPAKKSSATTTAPKR